MRRWVFGGGAVVAVALSAALAVQVTAGRPTPPQCDPSAFEATSVRESAPRQGMSFSVRPGGHLEIRGHSLRWLVGRAYGLDSRRVLQGPDWSEGQRFGIDAVVPSAQPAGEARLQAMLRRLLTDRFALRVQIEERIVPHYALVLADPRGGLGGGIHPSTTDCDAWRSRRERAGPLTRDMATEPHCGLRFRLRSRRLMELDLGAQTTAEFAAVLQPHAGRLVEDETGLVGRFDIGLAFSVEPAREGQSVFEALEQQLGLRLEARRGLVEMVVVESAERPSPN